MTHSRCILNPEGNPEEEKSDYIGLLARKDKRYWTCFIIPHQTFKKFYFIFSYVYLGMSLRGSVYMTRYLKRPSDGARSPEARVAGGPKSPNMGTRN